MEGVVPPPTIAWAFGNQPLPQMLALAPILRRLTGAALSLEHEENGMAQLIEYLIAAEEDLSHHTPADPSPRIGPEERPDRRVYLDHGRNIGSFNPCFPEYEIRVERERAYGSVSFPPNYEGPPGCVHGGFLAVFFDCIIQHHNCEFGVAGKTTTLKVEYLRPAPLLTSLRFEIERSSDAKRITSMANLQLDEKVVCKATMEAVAGDRSRLPDVSPRRGQP
jgi:acyl-coenzyme A thioesterase PaaI-like protein